MFELTVKTEFSAAHFLRKYKGPCANLHGHNYKVALTVMGGKLNETGFVADFVDLKKHMSTVVDRLDHTCLNDLEHFKDNNPTAENIAKYIFAEYKKLIQPLKLVKVQVWESDRADVVYYE
jgi:6-pyruvoyltetrahydropterin/6-carboxytetrahydropterin synthase